MIAKRALMLWVAVCDECHCEGIAADRRHGQTRKQRREAFGWAAGSDRRGELTPALDGKWMCGACKEKKGKK